MARFRGKVEYINAGGQSGLLSNKISELQYTKPDEPSTLAGLFNDNALD